MESRQHFQQDEQHLLYLLTNSILQQCIQIFNVNATNAFL